MLKTAISDLEVENVEQDGFLWSIAYPLSDGSGTLTVATTRPETMLGDAALAVHPEDERYAHLVGKTVKLPLTDREIPIIADTYVEREFGTGVVKITPAHDFNDYQVGQRHDLPLINILTPTAAINDTAPEKYRGLDRYEARKQILADLENEGLLVETKPHKLQVPKGDRTGQVIEPYLTDQWFVKMDAPAANAASKLGERRRRAVSCPATGSTPIATGWRTCRTGASAASCGGAIASRRGSMTAAMSTSAATKPKSRAQALARRRRGPFARTTTCWKPGSARGLWPFSTLGWPDDAGDGRTRFRPLPAQQRAGHRLRHHLLLGRAHDHG